MCQTQAVSFATERLGCLHRKTEIQKVFFFHTLQFHIPLLEVFCFAFLCFFSPCFCSSLRVGSNIHAAVNLRKQIWLARSPTVFKHYHLS